MSWQADALTPIAVHDRERLELRRVVEEPAIVEGPDTNYAVDPGWKLTVEDYTNLWMSRL